MARRDLAVARDEETGDEVSVSGSHYSINGTEPQLVPKDLRGRDEKEIARELLRRHCGEADDDKTSQTAG